jgi:probable phosphoglycerate mutase
MMQEYNQRGDFKQLTKLYLVRHGENTANITKEFSYKKIDYSLTPRGVIQARQTADYLRDKGIHAIYASPLKRAIETAEIIGQAVGLPVTVMENFREVNVGDLEGQVISKENWKVYLGIMKDWEAGKSESGFPNGENHLMLVERIRAGLEKVIKDNPGRNVVVVGHGGTFLAGLDWLCSDVVNRRRVNADYANCALSEMDIAEADGRYVGTLVSWAIHAHLTGEAAELTLAIPTELLES